MSNSIPDRWLEYRAYGDVIKGTNILAFKVPLKEGVSNNLQPEQRFTKSVLLEAFPRLKCIIDLTNTDRYYNGREFTNAGVRYEKIMVPGRVVPPMNVVKRFFKAMDDFTSVCGEEEIVGVHCTHGVNRTGYLICRYLIQQLGWEVEDSMRAFEIARGYPIERNIYVNALKQTPREKIDISNVTPSSSERPTRATHATHAKWRSSQSSGEQTRYAPRTKIPQEFAPRRHFEDAYQRRPFAGSFGPIPPGMPPPPGPPPFRPRPFRYGPPMRPAMPGFPLPRFPPGLRSLPLPRFPSPNIPPPPPPPPPSPAHARPIGLKRLQTNKKHIRNGINMQRSGISERSNGTITSRILPKILKEVDFTVDTYE